MKIVLVLIVLLLGLGFAVAVLDDIFLEDLQLVEPVPFGSAIANVEVKKFDLSDVRLPGWEIKRMGKRETEFTVTDGAGDKSIKASSKSSASALFHKIKISGAKDPYISWKWSVETFPDRKEPETLSTKKEYDFAAQVYVIFDSLNIFTTKAIQYVWANELAVGTMAPSPYTKNVRIMVLESGLADGFKDEFRDIRKDFKDLFGEDLKKDIQAIAITADSDSTDSNALSYFADLSLGYIDRTRALVKEQKEVVIPVERGDNIVVRFPALIKMLGAMDTWDMVRIKDRFATSSGKVFSAVVGRVRAMISSVQKKEESPSNT
ncbi:MAG: DUF3047 domain-containing protein [Candidatus Omnitrophica bacterium]|nr:DUF3047 domain-containing protein [Candidatus Omnitrophota bacterium]